ncbi:hypothetical protein [Nocardia sp. NPDC004260]
MTTLAEQGWTPVTAERSQGGYTWRVWVHPEATGWTLVEARDESGRMHSGGIGELDDVPEPEGPHFWVGTSDGFPTFVGVRFPDDYPSIEIETSHRQVTVSAEETESHFGKRFYAMTLSDDEDLVAVIGGGIRKPHTRAPGIGSGETGFYPSER